MGRLFKQAMLELQGGILPMCYVMPPMGTPFPHASGTSGMSIDKPRWRVGNWSKSWTLPGTRAVNPAYYGNRWLCHFVPRGNAKKLVQLGRPGHGPESWWLTRAPYCIRPDAFSVDPSFITSYTEYAQDIRGVGVWLSPGGSWHRCPGALTSGGSDV